MLSNLEQHFTTETIHHDINPLEEDDVSTSSEESAQLDGEDGVPELPWTEEEDDILRDVAESMEPKNWTAVAEAIPGRTNRECKRRWGQLQRSGDGRARTPWTKEEDEQLKELVAVHGSKAWKLISSMMPGRKSKQCRERWTNVVDPKLNYAPWTEEEEQILIVAQQELGNKWSQIEKRLPGRSANSIKNYWYSALRRGERKRAKMERKAMQPEGKKRRPRKQKSADEENVSVPRFVEEDASGEFGAAEAEEKPKKKGLKRKKKDEVADDSPEIVKDASLAVEEPPVSEDSEKVSKKPRKNKEMKSKAPKETQDVTVSSSNEEILESAVDVAEKKAKAKKAKIVEDPAPVEVAVAAIAVEEDSPGNGKSAKRKAAKPTEEEKLLKQPAKKRRKNIAITDENLSS